MRLRRTPAARTDRTTLGPRLSWLPLLAAAVLASTAGWLGCGPRTAARDGDRPPAIPADEVPGYLRSREDVRRADASALRGRRIVLDPGHGGRFRGALGPNGLAEADVNLGVALYLRGLLEDAGAHVFMTRTADRDLTAGTDTSLAGDLGRRVAFRDSLAPDAFVSIHHNSTPGRDPTINATQTYFPLGDDGASADLARAIHRHLAWNLGITPAQLLPGNFAVLRGSAVPAVLGEPAMLSHPVMAGRLTLAQSHRVEAEAYFLGLLEFFALGLPGWSGPAADTLRIDPTDAHAAVTWRFLPDRTRPGGAGPGPDPSSLRLLADGREAPFDLAPDGSTVTYRPPTLQGPVLLGLTGRNLAGQTAPEARVLLLPATAAAVAVQLTFESGAPSRPPAALIHWRIPPGSPVATDHAGGKLFWDSGFSISLDEALEGWRLAHDARDLAADRPPRFVPAAAPPGADGRVGAGTMPCTVTVDSLPAGWTWRELQDAQGRPWRPGGPLRARRPDGGPAVPPAGRLAPGAPVVCVPDTGAIWIEGAGILPLVDAVPRDPGRPRTVVAGERGWTAQAVLPECIGRVVVLDALGGGAEADGVGPLGARGADLNLATALMAADLLRGAGCEVHLTRRGDLPLSDQDKVLLARQARADVFVSIGRSASGDSAQVGHYPGSAAGTLGAARVAEQVAALLPGGGRGAVRAEADPHYLLRHTHCPALILRLPRRDTGDAQQATAAGSLPPAAAATGRAEARALLLGVASWLAADLGPTPAVNVAQLLADLPGGLPAAAVDLAVWDGYAAWLPGDPGPGHGQSVSSDAESVSAAVLLPARGPVHVLEVHAGARWQLWRLEAAADAWSPRLMLEER